MYAFVNFLLVAAFFWFGLMVEKLLPLSWQCSIEFPLAVTELYIKRVVGVFWLLGLLCLVTLPIWHRGYHVGMQAMGRPTPMTLYQTALELMYTTCQSTAIFQFNTPVVVIMGLCGYPFRIVHIFLGLLEFVFINYTVQFKFCALHQAAHDIRPLYNMIHLEHHICKGIHPTTSTVGLWEFFAFMGGDYFTMALGSIPYVLLQTQYLGANILVHTMWPSKKMLQWHILHHTVLADIYNVNVPSPRDMARSKDLKKYLPQLETDSPLIRVGWISDAIGLAMMIVGGLFLHYGLGWGVFRVWNDMILTCRAT